MLNFMRKHAGSWLIKIVLGAVIIVFVFFYGWGFKEREAGSVASVNGSVIPFNEFQKYHQNLLKLYRNEQLSPELIKALNLKQRALDSLINRVLILQEAEKLKLGISSEELRQFISSQPYFQKDGKFDRTSYLRFLGYNRTKPEEFESQQKHLLLLEKVKYFITSLVKLSEQEIYDAYATKNEKINLQFVRFKPSFFKDKIVLSQKEIEDYLSRHLDKFEIPPQVKVSYLCFKEEDFLKTVTIDPQTVKSYYESNQQQFQQPEQIKARHILIKTTSQDSPKTLAVKKKKAEEILKEVKKGRGDFPSLAGKYSEGPTAKKGGDLGYIQKGQTVKPFEEAVFSMKKGEISPLVKTDFGFHIIKVEDIKEATITSFESAREYIFSQLKKQQAVKLAAETADKVASQSYQSNDLIKVARENDLALKQTDYFSLEDNIPGIGNDTNFTSTAFSLREGEISPLIESQETFYLIKLDGKLPSRPPKLIEVEAKIKSALIDKKAEEKAKKKAEEFLQNLKKGGKISSLTSRIKIKLEETGLFVREGDSIPQIGNSKKIKDVAFSLTSQNPLYKKVLHMKNELLVISLKVRKEVGRKEYEQKKDDFAKILLEEKQDKIFNNWLDHIKEKAEITVNRDLMPDWRLN